MKNVKIDFIGVGAPRCGTTWIAECLMEHPEICFPYTKELNFFSKTRANNTKSEYEISGIEGYYKLFENCDGEKKKGEFSTYYMIDKNAAEIIKKHFPEIKIIIALRNPVDRAFSDYKNVKYIHLKEKDDFETAFFKFDKGLDSYSERGKYYLQLKKYFENFPKKNIKIIILEDVEKNPEKILKELYEFLEVDNLFVPSIINKKSNESKAVEAKTEKKFANWLSKIYRNLEWGFLGRILTGIKRKTKINEILWKKTRESEQKEIEEKLNPGLRERILEYYLDDIKKTEKLLGRKFEEWKI